MNTVSTTQAESEWKFFIPSREVVSKILQLNNNLGDEYFDKEYEELSKKEQSVSLPDKSMNDQEGLKSVSEIFSVLIGKAKSREGMSIEESVTLFQNTFSETIYNHLAMLGRSPGARRGKTFSISEELTEGIAEKLGLGLYMHDNTSSRLRETAKRILQKLALEFQKWLIEKQKGVYEAPWGEVCLFEKGTETSKEYPVLLDPDVPAYVARY